MSPKKIIVAVTGLVALFAGAYAAETRHMQRNWYKSGFATQDEREKIEDAYRSADN